jgi:hypothetical protein
MAIQYSVRPASGFIEPGAGTGQHSYFRDSPLNELALNRSSEVMSRYSTSAKKVGSTHVALGFLMGLVSFDFGLTTVSSCFLIWLETVRDGTNAARRA